jgi:hypothetical protein
MHPEFTNTRNCLSQKATSLGGILIYLKKYQVQYLKFNLK